MWTHSDGQAVKYNTDFWQIEMAELCLGQNGLVVETAAGCVSSIIG